MAGCWRAKGKRRGRNTLRPGSLGRDAAHFLPYNTWLAERQGDAAAGFLEHTAERKRTVF